MSRSRSGIIELHMSENQDVGRRTHRTVLLHTCHFLEHLRSFYSNGYGAPVPEVLTAPIAYHAIVLHRSFRGPRGEVRGVPTAIGEGRSCTPYLCQFDRMMADPPMLASGWAQSRRVGHVVGPNVQGHRDVAARSTFVISFPPPPEKTFSRLLIWVPKMRSCNEPSGCSEDMLVFDQGERELIRLSGGL
ncbi:hypothetical protein BHE74_00034447 [Ensete ventricosum]|nr:hypothetical protein BHE74_00034447 [Ensete ventricosum]